MWRLHYVALRYVATSILVCLGPGAQENQGGEGEGDRGSHGTRAYPLPHWGNPVQDQEGFQKREKKLRKWQKKDRQGRIWCCYITVDSSTTALQNGVCTYQCISKQMHYKTPFSHNGFIKSLEFYEKYITLFYLEKKNFLKYYINSEPCMAYYPKWLK